MMQRLLLIILLSVPWVGFARAQEATGKAADEAIKEITKIEVDKQAVLHEGGSAAADWFDRNNAETLTHPNAVGGLFTKAQDEEEWRKGVRKIEAIHQYDHQVRVYGKNANVAVVTYLGNVKMNRNGTTSSGATSRTTDVWFKQDGVWKRIAHVGTSIAAAKSDAVVP